jgi:hypothetical protein
MKFNYLILLLLVVFPIFASEVADLNPGHYRLTINAPQEIEEIHFNGFVYHDSSNGSNNVFLEKTGFFFDVKYRQRNDFYTFGYVLDTKTEDASFQSLCKLSGAKVVSLPMGDSFYKNHALDICMSKSKPHKSFSHDKISVDISSQFTGSTAVVDVLIDKRKI